MEKNMNTENAHISLVGDGLGGGGNLEEVLEQEGCLLQVKVIPDNTGRCSDDVNETSA